MKWAIPSLQRVREEAGDILLRIGEDLANTQRAGCTGRVALWARALSWSSHGPSLPFATLYPVASPRLDISGGLEPLVAQGSSLLLHDRRGALDGTGVSWEAYAKGSGVAWPGESRGAPPTTARTWQSKPRSLDWEIALGRTLLAEGDLRGRVARRGWAEGVNQVKVLDRDYRLLRCDQKLRVTKGCAPPRSPKIG